MKKQGQEVQVSEQAKPEPEVDVLTTLINEYETQATKKGDGDDEGETTQPLNTGKLLEGMAKLVESRTSNALAPIQAELKELKDVRDREQNAAYEANLSTDIESTLKKYPDLQEFKEGMTEVYGTPNLTVEECYIVARHRKLGGDFWNSYAKSDSEHPITLGQRETARPKDVRHGRSGFGEMLDDAVDRRR